jgi:hypothetical protein
MRGHLALLEMRRAGAAPDVVLVDCFPTPSHQAQHWPSDNPTTAVIEIEAGDRPARLDLRCLIGLDVTVNGFDSQQVAAVEAAVIAAKARTVTAAVLRRNGWRLDTDEFRFTNTTKGA